MFTIDLVFIILKIINQIVKCNVKDKIHYNFYDYFIETIIVLKVS